MRVTKRTSIAMRLLMYCVVNPGVLVTKREVAERCDLSENHLAQVVNQLAQLGYLTTQRGRKGGLMLARPATEIKVGDVFRDVEGEVPPGECFADVENSCGLLDYCQLKEALNTAADAFYGHLDGTFLSDLVCDNTDVMDHLSPAGCAGSKQMAAA